MFCLGKKYWFLLSLPLFLMLTFASISSCKKENAQNYAKTLRLYLQGEPLSLDPRIGGNRSSQVFIRDLFEGLMRIGASGKPEFAVAKSVDVSADGCTYLFHLGDSFWSTGDRVSAYDFEYAWKSILTPTFSSSYSYAFNIIKGARQAKQGAITLNDVGIKALDENTLQVVLDHPAPYFLELACNPLYSPVFRKIAEQNPDWSKNGGPSFVSNGPFSLASWKHQTQFELGKNPFYRDAKNVQLDAISVAIIDDPQTALNLFEKGEFDMAGEPFGTISLEAVAELSKENKLNTEQIDALYWLEVNTKNKLLSSAKIRRALACAINRKEITDNLLSCGEKPAFSILPRNLTLAKAPLFQDHDIATATTLFQEGLQDLQLENKTLEPLTITYWSDPKEKAIAQVIQEEWSKAFGQFGVEIALIACDWPTFFKKISSSEYQIAASSWFTWYEDPIYNMEFMKYRSSGLNGTNWENGRYIELLDLADQELDLIKRDELLAQAEQLIVDEMPIIPVFSQTYKYLKNPRLEGVYLSPVGMLELKDAHLACEKI